MKLKPCPFCGGSAEKWIDDEGYWVVICYKCNAKSGNHIEDTDAIKAWNQRHNEPPTIDEVPPLDNQKR